MEWLETFTYHKFFLHLLMCSAELVHHKIFDCLGLLRLRVVDDLPKGAQVCGVFLSIGVLCASFAKGIAELESFSWLRVWGWGRHCLLVGGGRELNVGDLIVFALIPMWTIDLGKQRPRVAKCELCRSGEAEAKRRQMQWKSLQELCHVRR